MSEWDVKFDSKTDSFSFLIKVGEISLRYDVQKNDLSVVILELSETLSTVSIGNVE